MTQAIEDNTKALNRLTNTLLTIFKVAPAVGEVAKPGPVAPAEPAAAPTSTTKVTKTPPEPATPAAAASASAAIPQTRATASALAMTLAGGKGEGQGKDAIIGLLATFSDAEGNPCKAIKAFKDEDIPVVISKLVDILGEAACKNVLGIK